MAAPPNLEIKLSMQMVVCHLMRHNALCFGPGICFVAFVALHTDCGSHPVCITFPLYFLSSLSHHTKGGSHPCCGASALSLSLLLVFSLCTKGALLWWFLLLLFSLVIRKVGLILSVVLLLSLSSFFLLSLRTNCSLLRCPSCFFLLILLPLSSYEWWIASLLWYSTGCVKGL